MDYLPHLLPYSLLATLLMAVHLAVVLFVVGGLLGIVAGNRLGWRWVNGFRFRCLHLGLILFVALETWLGLVCPLTVWENWLKGRAGQAAYDGGFVEHWLRTLLYWEAPAWVFLAGYSAFALAAIACWRLFPPQRRSCPGNKSPLILPAWPRCGQGPGGNPARDAPGDKASAKEE